ncbi:MAG: S8 family serine peptidase [bacterium]
MSLAKKIIAFFQIQNRPNYRPHVRRERFVTAYNDAINIGINHNSSRRRQVIRRYNTGFTYSIIKNKKNETRFLVRTVSYTVAVMLVFSIFNFASASLSPTQDQVPDGVVKNEILVKYRNKSASVLTSIERDRHVLAKEQAFDDKVLLDVRSKFATRTARAESINDVPADLANVIKVKVEPGANIPELIMQYRLDPNVESVSYNYLKKLEYSPNDPLYGTQYNLTSINAGAAIDINEGAPAVVIAVLDSGVQGTHDDFTYADLSTKVLAGYDFGTNTAIPANSNSDTSASPGHGTAVAGTAAALCNNAKGISGIACNNKIMPVKIADAAGLINTITVTRAILYAVANGADIINLSIGSEVAETTVYDSFMDDALKYAHDNGVVTVVAAGNGEFGDKNIGDDIAFSSPASSPYAIVVGATGTDNARVAWSNYGSKLDFMAPGVAIPVPSATAHDQYKTVAGTSFSAPTVSGVIGLMLSENPSLTVEQIRQILRKTATDMGTAGFDINTGYGLINAGKAMTAVSSTMPSTAFINPVQNVNNGSRLITGTASGPLFHSYSLEYGSTTQPSSGWTVISTSHSPVTDSTLGTWDTSSMGAGNYTIRLTVTNNDTPITTSTFTTYAEIVNIPKIIVNNPGVTNDTTPTITGKIISTNGKIIDLAAYAVDSSLVANLSEITLTPTGVSTEVNYSFTTPQLTAGNHRIWIAALDSSTVQGNYDLSLSIDITAPIAPVIASPVNNDIVNTDTVDVSGTAEPNSTVTVYVDSASVGTTKTDSIGVWAKNSVPLAAGENNLEATATDVANNVSVKSTSVNVSRTAGPSIGLAVVSTSVIAGTEFNITASALDADTNVNTGFRGTVTLTSSDSAATLPTQSNHEYVSADNGVFEFTGITLRTAGAQTITATVSNDSEYTVKTFIKRFTVSAAPATEIIMESGNSQSAVVNRYLKDPLVVLVKDTYGNPVPNKDLSINVTVGGGLAVPSAITTGSNGMGSTTFKMGSTVGSNALTIGADGLTAVTFTATATIFIYNVTPGEGSSISQNTYIQSSDTNAKAAFDVGAVTENTNVTISKIAQTHSPTSGKIYISGSDFYDFTAEKESGELVTSFPENKVMIAILFNAAIAESVIYTNPSLYFWNKDTSVWDQAGVNEFMGNSYGVVAMPTHFTGFAAMADGVESVPSTYTDSPTTSPTAYITKLASTVGVATLPSTGTSLVILYELIIALLFGLVLSLYHPQMIKRFKRRK